MTVLLAATPLAIVLVGMVALRQSAVVAGTAGLAATIFLAVRVFDFRDGDVRQGIGTAAEAVHSTGTILWVIFPALALYEFQMRTGAIERIRGALSGLSENRRVQALLIAWFFALFIEGAAGFGTPVALSAPLLVGLGYPPVRAVALALLGHAAAVPFAAVGTPTLAQLQLADLDVVELSATIAALNMLVGVGVLLFMVRLADDGPLTRSELGWTALAAVCFFVPSLTLAMTVGPELPSLGGALFGAAVFISVLRFFGGRAPDLRKLCPDLTPYLMILALVLATRLIGPVQDALRSIDLGWTYQQRFSGSFEPLYHPGTMLIVGLILSAIVTARGGFLAAATVAALRRLVPVGLALLVMLALSRTMVHSGMISDLAEAAARLGDGWPIAAPAVGVLGTFITGSATASNILFTELQVSTAAALSLSPYVMVAAQGFGAAIGNTIAPHNIIAGSATVGLVGREGDVLAKTGLACAICTIVGGLAVLAFTTLA